MSCLIAERDGIDAPAIQVIQEGFSGSLNCSYNDPTRLITWLWGQDGSPVTGHFVSATFADEGLYTCDIYIPSSAASTRVPVTLHVVGEYSCMCNIFHMVSAAPPHAMQVDLLAGVGLIQQCHNLAMRKCTSELPIKIQLFCKLCG